ncbi:MAG: hypothetical protein E3J87_02140 [Candidatus Cloacimonadota bacterium]|nr:MAG: hypothetical protein E3J87_02140 [Candidatus Cloacimonadota bacterium]
MPIKGKAFELKVSEALKKKYKKSFSEKAIEIGHSPKKHKFDLVSEDEKIFVECKSLSWTKTDNVPSGKISTINEAVLFLANIKKRQIKRIIVLRKDWSRKKKTSLSHYYVDHYSHLLKGIIVLEYNLNTKKLEEIKNKHSR